MANLGVAIVSAIQTSLLGNLTELQTKLELDTPLPVEAAGDKINIMVPKAQKLDTLLSQPNYTKVPSTERKKKDGTTVSVRSYKRKTIKPTLDKAIKACEADEADTQQTTDAISEYIADRIQHGLGNLKSASL